MNRHTYSPIIATTTALWKPTVTLQRQFKRLKPNREKSIAVPQRSGKRQRETQAVSQIAYICTDIYYFERINAFTTTVWKNSAF